MQCILTLVTCVRSLCWLQSGRMGVASTRRWSLGSIHSICDQFTMRSLDGRRDDNGYLERADGVQEAGWTLLERHGA